MKIVTSQCFPGDAWCFKLVWCLVIHLPYGAPNNLLKLFWFDQIRIWEGQLISTKMWVFRLYWYQKYCTESIPQLVQAKVQFNFTCEINTTLLDRILPSQEWHTHYSESEWFFSSSRVSGSFSCWQRNGTCAKPGSGSHSRPTHTHTYTRLGHLHLLPVCTFVQKGSLLFFISSNFILN